VKDDSSDHITCAFPVADIQVLWSRHNRLHLSIIFSNQRFSNCSPAVGVGLVKFTLDFFFLKQGLQDEYSVLLSSALQLFSNFSKQSFSMYEDLSVSIYFRPLFLFADFMFPCFVYADIMLETIALDTPKI
jgi:hypothetical protein